MGGSLTSSSLPFSCAGFPWADLPKDSVVVDVGGGIGSVSVKVAEAFPHLRFVVEDRAPVVALAQHVRALLFHALYRILTRSA